jgi:hypothetical protein
MKSMIFILMLVFSSLAFAAPVQRLFQDVKLPTQGVIEIQTITAPIAAATTRVLSANAGPTSAAAKVVTSFAAQPDVPRNLTITPGGTTGDVESCVITVAGTNIFAKAISETFTFSADASSAVVGNKAFATVTSVSWPANCESGGFAATWSVGVGEKIGLKRCMADAGSFIQSSLGGAHEATLATVAADASNVEGNTADFNGTMNGSNNFKAYFIQNYGCFP